MVMPSSNSAGKGERGRIVIGETNRMTSSPGDSFDLSMAQRSVPTPLSASDSTSHSAD